MDQTVQNISGTMGTTQQETLRLGNGKTLQAHKRIYGTISLHAPTALLERYLSAMSSRQTISKPIDIDTRKDHHQSKVYQCPSIADMQTQNSCRTKCLRRGIMLQSTPIFLIHPHCPCDHTSSCSTCTSCTTSHTTNSSSASSSASAIYKDMTTITYAS